MLTPPFKMDFLRILDARMSRIMSYPEYPPSEKALITGVAFILLYVVILYNIIRIHVHSIYIHMFLFIYAAVGSCLDSLIMAAVL